jgi:hypothetical protein
LGFFDGEINGCLAFGGWCGACLLEGLRYRRVQRLEHWLGSLFSFALIYGN